MTSRAPRSRSEGGYIVALTLVLVVTILTLSVTMMHHVVEANQSSSVTSEALSDREAAYSGVNLAQQSMKVGVDLDAKAIANGTSQATVETIAVDTFTESIHSQVLDHNGMGATLLAQATKAAAPAASEPSGLPVIDAATLTGIMADSSIPKHYYNGMTWLSDTELEGLVIVESGSAVFFDNVIVHGCILSEDAITTDAAGAYDPDTLPCAVTMGTLKVVPGDFLPGVAVVMPEGLFTSMSVDANVQLEGDVIVHSLTLPDTGGSVLGNICTVADADLGDAEHTSSRGDSPWASDLDTGSSWTTASVAFVPYRADPSDLSAITGFAGDQ